jgi:hypothetical protein
VGGIELDAVVTAGGRDVQRVVPDDGALLLDAADIRDTGLALAAGETAQKQQHGQQDTDLCM